MMSSLITEIQPLVLKLGPMLKKMGDREFFELCRSNPDLRIEQTSEGDLVIMTPTGGETGRLNFTLIGLFNTWVVQDGSGIGFASSTRFTLPNGAKRSPDVAWVKRTRWDALTAEERAGFPPLCPDFIIELRSQTDPLGTLRAKMDEYLANGTSLGWLLDPVEGKVYVYQPQADVLCLETPESLSGEPVLPGFRLPLTWLWE
ncbi:MAG: Uma2 family endonuclease [Anaerolineae bacterium]|nr:Uma2 family endonuclease [Anaerolineae bacterium]